MTQPAVDIREDDLRGPEIIALLERHLDNARQVSPPGTVYALDLDALRRPEVTMWTAWSQGDLLGCAALMDQHGQWGEIKSMHTAAPARGRGVGAILLKHMLSVARARGYDCLRLETGNNDAFAPARRLYARHGFVECGPFGDYGDNGFSYFMALDLD